MKILTALFFALCAAFTLLSAESKTNSTPKVPAAEAGQHVGRTLTVYGKIAEVHIAEKLVRLNFDEPFPRQSFTAVVFSTRTNLFPDLKCFKDAYVEITGKITEYRERPEMILSTTNQIQGLQKPE